MANVPDHFFEQSGVIAYRDRPSGRQVLLVSSRGRRRWVIPKGVREPGLSAAESAAKEALEEAGVTGSTAPKPVGRYSYPKWGGICTVEVYALAVEKELSEWPESFRERSWLSPAKAAEQVREPELKGLILQVGRDH